MRVLKRKSTVTLLAAGMLVMAAGPVSAQELVEDGQRLDLNQAMANWAGADRSAGGVISSAATNEDEQCAVTWADADGTQIVTAASYVATGEMDAELSTVCAGVAAVADDAVGLLSWVDGERYHVVGLAGDGDVSFETPIATEDINIPGARLGGGADGLVVTGLVDDVTTVARFDDTGAETFAVQLIGDECLEEVQASDVIATSTVLLARDCSAGDAMDVWVLGAGGARVAGLLAGADLADTFRPDAMLVMGSVVHMVGAALDGETATGMRWVAINANNSTVMLDYTLADTAGFVDDAKHISAGGDGVYLATTNNGLTGLWRLDPADGAILAAFDLDGFEGLMPLALLANPTEGAQFVVGDAGAVNIMSIITGEVVEPIDDRDEDTIADEDDNCPDDPNTDQSDVDDDGLGDVCDSDIDDDGISNGSDNCDSIANPDQIDSDFDGIGDPCDGDVDGDGVDNDDDNCPDISNSNQRDADRDDRGDVCDGDRDGDGIGNIADNCPDDENTDQRDRDEDGRGDACDNVDNATDTDRDGVPDFQDNCPEDGNPMQNDLDGDGEGDICEDDLDGDGVLDGDDNCVRVPNTTQLDSDGDGTGDACQFQDPPVVDNQPDSQEPTEEPRQTPPPPVDSNNTFICTVAQTPAGDGSTPSLFLMTLLALGLLTQRRRR